MSCLNEQKKEELRVLQKEEGLKRMKALKILGRVREEFRRGKLNYSERGILFWLNEEEQDLVKRFELEHDAVVYHVIKDHLEFGLCYSLLYVSCHPEEWEGDMEDLYDGIQIVYVHNMNGFSEFGSIGLRPFFGAVVRTA